MIKRIVFLFVILFSVFFNNLFAQNCVENNLKTLGQISDVDAYLQTNKKRVSVIKEYANNKSDSLILAIENFHRELDACNKETPGLENLTLFAKIQSSVTLLKVVEVAGKTSQFQELMTELDAIYPSVESLPIDFSYPNGAEEGRIKISKDNAESTWLAYAFYRASYEARRGNWASADRYLQYGAKKESFKTDLTFLGMYFKSKQMLKSSRKTYFSLLPNYTKYLIVKVEDVLPGSSGSSFRNSEFIDSILTYEVSSAVALAENDFIDKNGFIRQKIADNLYNVGKYELSYKYAVQASEVSTDKELAYFINDYVGKKFPERQEESNAAANKIFKSYIDASSNVPDLISVKDYANKEGLKELEELAIARLTELNKNYKTVENRLKDSRRTVGVELRAETYGLFLGHVPMYLRIRIRNFINDFMFDYVDYEKSKYRYGGFRNQPLPAVKAPFQVSNGYSLGYGLKYIVLRDFIQKDRRVRYSGLAIGPEFRYSRWRMNQRNIQVYTDETMVNYLGARSVQPLQVRFEGTVLLDFQFAWRFFSLGFHVGAGIGHRNLKEPGFATEYWKDSHYTQARFNKFYVPVRFGIFLGIGYTSGR